MGRKPSASEAPTAVWLSDGDCALYVTQVGGQVLLPDTPWACTLRPAWTFTQIGCQSRQFYDTVKTGGSLQELVHFLRPSELRSWEVIGSR